ncbi:MAG: thioesterase domain-containing protein [Cellvibrionaceae bacterium]|nr:thioesterase domain-containing protein [Cellvibrionaceae bacterium]MCV6626939.1 thioesterase domain-containing protein [Cellvibrionaceae bacterium]
MSNVKVTDKIGIPIIEHMGAEILEVSKGRVVAKMPKEPNANHVGTMYAGSLFTLAEFPGGVLFLDYLDGAPIYPIVAEMNIRYRRPATTDIYVDMQMALADLDKMKADTLANGKAEMTHRQELTDESGEVVAISEARYVWLKA